MSALLVVMLAALALLRSAARVDGDDDSRRKLQIGVKRRAPDGQNCRKSAKGDVLHVEYRGWLLESGLEFDASSGRPLAFTLGSGQVIQGWDQGLLAMCAGERRKLVVPPELAYGSAGAPPTIPGDATLVFEVECVRIESRKAEL